MNENTGEFVPEESDEEIHQRWERTKPLADKLERLRIDDPEDQAGYDEIIDHLVREPKDAFYLFSNEMDLYPKPADPEMNFNSMPVFTIADLVRKMVERIK